MKEKLQPKPSYANKERSIYDIFFLGEHPKKCTINAILKIQQQNSRQKQTSLKTA